ncbi:MAG: Crp/Fnr family transcriptional regulator [Halanaerobiales bacterium]|nr:Crp/Fnr family transcriptional regulator [Halanaerobiales bacterium]
MEELQNCLKDLTVFSRLESDELELVCQSSFEKYYQKGEIIFFENDDYGGLYLLVSGRVKLSMLSPEGKEKVLNILQEGDIMGEVSFFDLDPHPITAEAMENARIVIIPREKLEDIITKKPGLALKIIESLAKKTRLLTSQVRELVFHDAAGRMASLLSRFADDFGVEINGGKMIDIILTHKEIANLIGSSRVTVTKIINNFIDEGVIKMHKRKIVIVDEEKLGKKLHTSI